MCAHNLANDRWTALQRPSQVLDAVPEKANTVHIVFKGTDIVCEHSSIAQEVEEFIEDGEVDPADRNEVIGLLRQQKAIEEQKNREVLESKIGQFRGMVDNMSKDNTDVLRKLEEMKVFKVFPSNIPEPKMSWTGMETGFRKNLMVNRYIGNADGFY